MGIDIGIIFEGLSTVLEPSALLLMIVGVFVGIVVGMIPGLSATMAVALLIPFTFSLEPTIAMSFLVAIFVGGMSGGAISAILIRIPGTPASIASLLDGFPMAKKGQAGQALGHAVIASLFGTLISGVFLVVCAPLLAEFALKFHFAEYVAVCLFALTSVIAVGGSTLSRGLVTALLGLLLSSFGISQVDGLPRFDFGFPAMLGGFSLVPALMGLFAVSRIIHESTQPTQAKDIDFSGSIGRILPKINVVGRNLVNYVRSSVIGTIVGVMPAVGGGPAGLIAYAQARNASKTPDKFGTGVPEGVIAAESANNATVGGTLIITLTLGIPGDAVTAMLLGGLMVQGLQPGPLLFINSPEVIYSIYFSVFFSAIAMAAIVLLTVRALVKVIEVPKQYFLPILFVLAAAGIYSMNNRMFDVGVMCGFGLLGYLLERFKYPLPPFVLGFLLGPLIESNLRKMVIQEESILPLFMRPISLTLLLMGSAFLGYSLWKRKSSPSS